ncbi:hypothetical protein P3T76_015337 [Phytophthora citrophthora]|uniref:TKL protein kinase n=1 Tax=Phytophthora citrophthora TaxID=4793 RepID=A0AAD9FZL2_9STRA|nr:hypothetical protein P3T76_015337 [Phytophthora citrophthora]
MRLCVRTTSTAIMLALSVRNAASEVSVCSLPASSLHVSTGNALVACALEGSSELSTMCQTACSCRKLKHDQNVYGVCLNDSASFNCDGIENATQCGKVFESSYLEARATNGGAIARALASDDSNGGGLKAWQWALIGLAIAFVVGLLIFVYNWFKHRPQHGDNRREVVQSLEQSRSQPKDDVNMLPIALRDSQTRTATRESAARTTTRSQDTNQSQISGFSGASYRTYAGNPMSSTLTDTEIVAQHQERAFSPISDSAHSSDYSQGVDTSTTPNTSLLGPSRAQDNSSDSEYPSFSSYSISSGMDSFSSDLTVEGSDIETGGSAPYPRKKSIEF